MLRKKARLAVVLLESRRLICQSGGIRGTSYLFRCGIEHDVPRFYRYSLVKILLTNRRNRIPPNTFRQCKFNSVRAYPKRVFIALFICYPA